MNKYIEELARAYMYIYMEMNYNLDKQNHYINLDELKITYNKDKDNIKCELLIYKKVKGGTAVVGDVVVTLDDGDLMHFLGCLVNNYLE